MDLSAEQLADRQEIVEVIDRYGTALDAKDYDRFRSCFSDDARVSYGGNEHDLDGAVGICEAALSQYEFTQHLLGNYDIDLDGDRATARTYLHASHVKPGGTEIWIVGGTYIDTLERRDGDWKITARTLDSKWSELRKLGS